MAAGRLVSTKAPLLDRSCPVSSLLRAFRYPVRPGLTLAGVQLRGHTPHRMGFACCGRFPCAYVPRPLPRRDQCVRLSLFCSLLFHTALSDLAVPEPSSLSLLALGVLAISWERGQNSLSRIRYPSTWTVGDHEGSQDDLVNGRPWFTKRCKAYQEVV